jgi:2'-5' RNA ligase
MWYKLVEWGGNGMTDKRIYLLAIFDKDTQRRMTGYYAALTAHGLIGQQTTDIPYHFTLGDIETEHEAEIVARTEEVCATTQPIEFRMDHIGLFGLKVLFLEPNMNFELLQLQSSLFPGCGHGYTSWAAHGTILLDEPEAILKAVPLAAQKFTAFPARIESVAVYEFFPVRFIKEIQLGTS